MWPQRSGSSQVTRHPAGLGEVLDRVEHRVVLDAAGDDPVEGGVRAPRRASQAPLTARLSDSVPPEVKTTSDGRAPSAAPIRSRASSTTARAARPEVCSEEGLPTTADCSIRASSAAGSIGVVAAWSR